MLRADGATLHGATQQPSTQPAKESLLPKPKASQPAPKPKANFRPVFGAAALRHRCAAVAAAPKRGARRWMLFWRTVISRHSDVIGRIGPMGQPKPLFCRPGRLFTVTCRRDTSRSGPRTSGGLRGVFGPSPGPPGGRRPKRVGPIMTSSGAERRFAVCVCFRCGWW